MNKFILICLAACIALSAASAPYNYGASAYRGHIGYVRDATGNTVPFMGHDQNNDGVNDAYDSNRDGKPDPYANNYYRGYGYNAGYHNGYGFGHGRAYYNRFQH